MTSEDTVETEEIAKPDAAAEALAALSDLREYVVGKLDDAVVSDDIAFGELNITVSRGKIVPVMKFLRDDKQCEFECLIDVCGVDYPGRGKRFDVVYHLLSPRQNHRIRIRVQTDGETAVPSVTEVFPAANWFEREAFDLYGILFSDHPDLRRLLTDYGFQGYPLRKDFPLTGYVEVRYDDAKKKVVYELVKLTQEFRNFDYVSPWEGPEYVLPGDEKATADDGKAS